MASYISLLDLTYPVGAYYLSSVSTSPASFFGGAWSVLTGKFLYCNSGTGTGGSNTHALTSSQMPSYSHSLYLYTTGSGAYVNLKEPTGRSQAVTTSLSSTSRTSFSNTITSTGGVCSQQYASISDVLLLEKNLLTSAEVRRNG